MTQYRVSVENQALHVIEADHHEVSESGLTLYAADGSVVKNFPEFEWMGHTLPEQVVDPDQ